MATDDVYEPTSDLDSDDDLDRPGPSRRNKRAAKSKAKDSVNAWEGTYKRSWDQVQEDEQGGIQAAVESLIARGRRKRYVLVARDLELLLSSHERSPDSAAHYSPRRRCAGLSCGTCTSLSTCPSLCGTRISVQTGSS